MPLTPRTGNWSNAAVRALRHNRDYAWDIRDHLWEHDIVERIRNGCAGPQAISIADFVGNGYSFSSQGWEAAEKHAAKANRLHSAFLDDASIAKRAEKREQLKSQMEEVKAAWRAFEEGKAARPTWEDPATKEQRKYAAAKRAAENKRQLEAEREAREAPIRAERAERQAKERIELDRMLAAANHSPDVEKFKAEEKRILDSKWSCTVCGGKSTIERESPGYQLTCISCGKTAWGSHKALWEVLSR